MKTLREYLLVLAVAAVLAIFVATNVATPIQQAFSNVSEQLEKEPGK